MGNKVYVVATVKPWNIKVFHEVIKHYPGQWHLITDPHDLNVDKIVSLRPEFIFFPHWSHIVPAQITNMTNCVCFHETDLPYGRGGSPIQNLIIEGRKETVITAIKMVKELDAGPVYMKEFLSLEGLAEEIFIRAAYIIADMIKKIILDPPKPKEQTGSTVVFKRRTPKQSEISEKCDSLADLFDHLRMLDADGYPKAYFERGHFRYEITRPAIKTDEIVADLRIRRIEGEK